LPLSESLFIALPYIYGIGHRLLLAKSQAGKVGFPLGNFFYQGATHPLDSLLPLVLSLGSLALCFVPAWGDSQSSTAMMGLGQFDCAQRPT